MYNPQCQYTIGFTLRSRNTPKEFVSPLVINPILESEKRIADVSYFSSGIKMSAAELIQYRFPKGAGPSSKT